MPPILLDLLLVSLLVLAVVAAVKWLERRNERRSRSRLVRLWELERQAQAYQERAGIHDPLSAKEI